MREILIRGMLGLGDNILQRPFVRAAAAQYDDVYLETPWPELYCDLPVHLCKRPTSLRSQVKNAAKYHDWAITPRSPARTVIVSYQNATGSFQSAMEAVLPLGDVPYSFNLPNYNLPPIDMPSDKPMALVRPVTVRREWRNEARNPRPEYIEQLAQRLMKTHFVVVVADLLDGEEWLVGNCPPHHLALLRGELSTPSLLALVQAADVCLGGVGWLTVAAIAYRRPVFTVLGGMGGINSIARITDPRMMLSSAGFAIPERFCRCTNMTHACDKTIANLEQTFLNWLAAMRTMPRDIPAG
jgi:hypothetical protein